ncbi:Hypothetical protein NTJ_06078 [Nesidiocoris tenuis]|uniref:Uncharacterized protein n=1 Tax=Nesidiocoris tenuis TaxID=355587 RepID=A0ABN7APR7_9HEMI|nr:Hypothetical protein NTJ_06078 [Nesidiocoris tenuis]
MSINDNRNISHDLTTKVVSQRIVRFVRFQGALKKLSTLKKQDVLTSVSRKNNDSLDPGGPMATESGPRQVRAVSVTVALLSSQYLPRWREITAPTPMHIHTSG